jgi:hypothetical protein
VKEGRAKQLLVLRWGIERRSVVERAIGERDSEAVVRPSRRKLTRAATDSPRPDK